MARITIEDCLKVVPNSFELVILAAKRARDLYAGAEKLVECDNKESVTALREIAANKLDLQTLKINVVKDVISGKAYENEASNAISSFDNLFEMEDEGFKIKSNNMIQEDIFGSHNIEE